MIARFMLAVSISLAGLSAALSAPMLAAPALPSLPIQYIGCAYEPDPGSGTSARHVRRNNCPQDYDEPRQPANGHRASPRR